MRRVNPNRLDDFIARPKRAVWTVGAPLMFGSAVHALYSIADTAFIGRLGPEALAAATFVVPLFFVAVAVANGLVIGTTATVARAIGRRDKPAADAVASRAFGLSIGIGIAFAVTGFSLAPQMLAALGAEGKSAELAWEYFVCLTIGMPFFFLSSAIRAVLTAEGDAKTPTIIMTFSTVLNVTLDPIFIFALDLGIFGAALATTVAITAGCAIYMYIAFVRKKLYVRIHLAHIWPQIPPLIPVAKVGVPAAANQLLIALGMGLNNRVLAYFGETAVAGYGAASKVDMLVALPILGLGGAAVTVVGMFAGAKRVDLIRATTLYIYRSAVLISIALGLTAFALSQVIIALFTDDAQTIAVGTTYLNYMVFAYPAMAFGIITGRLLQGIGLGWPSLIITLVRVVLVAIPCAYAAVYLLGFPIESVWLSFIAGGVLSTLLAIYWVRAHIWLRDPSETAQPASGAS